MFKSHKDTSSTIQKTGIVKSDSYKLLIESFISNKVSN